MKIPFSIYLRAVGLYALLTLPALFIPVIYIISLFYVLFYGWFAWGLFTVIYLITEKVTSSYPVRMAVLSLAVPVSVVFSFQMLQVLGIEENIWHTGSFLLFPLAAAISGWLGLFTVKEKIEASINERFEHAVDDSGLFD